MLWEKGWFADKLDIQRGWFTYFAEFKPSFVVYVEISRINKDVHTIDYQLFGLNYEILHVIL